MNRLKEIIHNILKEEPHFFTTTEVPSDGEGRSMEWDVTYEPNLDKIYQGMLTLVKQLEDAEAFYKGDDMRKIIALGKELRRRIYNMKVKTKHLEEESATNMGGASFTAGQGEGYATPAAFAPKTNSKGTKNIYYYKLGFKPVPNKIKGSGLQVKKLWEDEPLNEINSFQKQRLGSLDEIEKLMNEIQPLISNAKNETIELYSGNAGSYDINKPIEIVKSYLNDIKQLLSEK